MKPVRDQIREEILETTCPLVKMVSTREDWKTVFSQVKLPLLRMWVSVKVLLIEQLREELNEVS